MDKREFESIFREEGIKNRQIIEEIYPAVNLENLTPEKLRKKIKLFADSLALEIVK